MVLMSSSGLGWGDLEEEDEDGDGTWFDRQIGIPAIPATYMNPACGFNQPIFGDVSATFEALGMGSCVDYVDVATSGYLMDPSGSLATWGNTLTAHGALWTQCVGLLGEATCSALAGHLLTDDSAYDVDPTCMLDYAGLDLNSDGEYDPTICIDSTGDGELNLCEFAGSGDFMDLLDCAGRLL